jgi:hypothetical protein
VWIAWRREPGAEGSCEGPRRGCELEGSGVDIGILYMGLVWLGFAGFEGVGETVREVVVKGGLSCGEAIDGGQTAISILYGVAHGNVKISLCRSGYADLFTPGVEVLNRKGRFRVLYHCTVELLEQASC